MPRSKAPAGSQSILRALSLLRALEAGEASLEELATKASLNKSTVHRILSALMFEGFVDQDPGTRKYFLSYEALRLSVAARQQISFLRQAGPVLRRLARQTDETVHLSILAADKVVCVDKVESSKPVRIFSEIGLSGPLHCTGSGKCLMAFLSDRELDRLLDRLELRAYTKNTITNPYDLRSELVQIRKTGVAYDIEEHQADVICVAAPVCSCSDSIIAALSLALPSSRVSDDDLGKYANLVVAAATELSNQLGGRGMDTVDL